MRPCGRRLKDFEFSEMLVVAPSDDSKKEYLEVGRGRRGRSLAFQSSLRKVVLREKDMKRRRLHSKHLE